WQGEEFEQRTGTTCTIHSNVGDVRFDRALSTAVFRIFQEALTNIARHAHAKHVEVRFEKNDDELRLQIKDDGTGITTEALRNPMSLGLLGMRERARRLGGTATMSGEPGKGSLVQLSLPLHPSHSKPKEKP